jgi:uncharacterized membrane protein YqaE (UPF0057 family)
MFLPLVLSNILFTLVGVVRPSFFPALIFACLLQVSELRSHLRLVQRESDAWQAVLLNPLLFVVPYSHVHAVIN